MTNALCINGLLDEINSVMPDNVVHTDQKERCTTMIKQDRIEMAVKVTLIKVIYYNDG